MYTHTLTDEQRRKLGQLQCEYTGVMNELARLTEYGRTAASVELCDKLSAIRARMRYVRHLR